MLGSISVEGYVHGHNLCSKAERTGDEELKNAVHEYAVFRQRVARLQVTETRSVTALVQHFNRYRARVMDIFERRQHSGQENLRSTMLEEFFVHLFIDLVKQACGDDPPNLYVGKGHSYIDLAFTPARFRSMFVRPAPYVHSKYQDFLVGARFMLSVTPAIEDASDVHTEEIVIPVIAIECKTYLERNMLDSCAGTASRIKKAMPYCMYLVAAEYLKLDVAEPELTDIDEIFVLCRASNAQRLARVRAGDPVHPIDPDLVVSLFKMVQRHLNALWWSPEDVLRTGRVINRPT